MRISLMELMSLMFMLMNTSSGLPAAAAATATKLSVTRRADRRPIRPRSGRRFKLPRNEGHASPDLGVGKTPMQIVCQIFFSKFNPREI